VKFVDTKYAGHYGVKKSPYLFPTYFIGYPCKDQLIPTPDQDAPPDIKEVPPEFPMFNAAKSFTVVKGLAAEALLELVTA
jgi:hypothetical protein